eukprot:CAMPEP_0170114956 /NCGR_PEP_ID=MMETSP0020_2-20130122/11108_1 /TAXON_ID=98059 /ORGANISM="Dinobryon sp., Strain UTEXLB2267" /LENGTH=75 /DNA_ID=CAMNT_0010342233 /DNA_START=267 /DNA_END=494 /DNA_ORIENTATION=+
MGICEVAMKNPTKSICGTKSSGAISVTSFTFATVQPRHKATEHEHAPNANIARVRTMKLPLRLSMKKQMIIVTRL